MNGTARCCSFENEALSVGYSREAHLRLNLHHRGGVDCAPSDALMALDVIAFWGSRLENHWCG